MVDLVAYYVLLLCLHSSTTYGVCQVEVLCLSLYLCRY